MHACCERDHFDFVIVRILFIVFVPMPFGGFEGPLKHLEATSSSAVTSFCFKRHSSTKYLTLVTINEYCSFLFTQSLYIKLA
jgi:hypothetical protein